MKNSSLFFSALLLGMSLYTSFMMSIYVLADDIEDYSDCIAIEAKDENGLSEHGSDDGGE